MQTTPSQPHPVLARPPIVEVVCGVQFDPVDFDPLVLGVYWDRRSAVYPHRSLQPAVSDGGPPFVIGNVPLRAVLVAADQVHVLQIQGDRFFMNWRAVGKAYPRFSNRNGSRGLMAQALEEFASLSEYCVERFGVPIQPKRVELAKIDMVERGKHWNDLDHLQSILPITGTFSQVHRGGNRELALRFVENDPNSTLVISLNSIAAERGGEPTAIRIETRGIVPVVDGQIETAFVMANDAVNAAFFTLISDAGRTVFGANSGGE